MAVSPYLVRNNPMSFIGGLPLQGGDSSASQLQSTISAATSGIGELPPGVTHHPITCTNRLGFDEDGIFSCSHNQVPADDPRTKACLNHSLALLIIEEAFKFTGIKEPDAGTIATEGR